MKIINLRGTSDVGKSTALNCVIDMLQIVSSEYEVSYHPSGETNEDRKAWFVFKDKRIGICTGGDTSEIVTENFRYCQEQGCDIAVTASRAWGQVVEKLKNLARYHVCEIEYIKINNLTDAKTKAVDVLNMILEEVNKNEEN